MDFLEFIVIQFCEDDLADPVSLLERDIFVGEVNDDCHPLVAITGIDCTRRIDNGKAIP